MQAGVVTDCPEFTLPSMEQAADDSEQRLARIVRRDLAFVWRTLRRFGLTAADADDAAQQVFVIVSKRLAQIKPESERSFLFGTAMRIAARSRRAAHRRKELEPIALEEREDPHADLDSLLQQRQARAVLDEILDRMPVELKAVFVLYELEQLTMAEIATTLDLPAGTVASRLRRARENFHAAVGRRQVAPSGGAASAEKTATILGARSHGGDR